MGSPPLARTSAPRSSRTRTTRIPIDINELVDREPVGRRRLSSMSERERPEEGPRERDVEGLLRFLGGLEIVDQPAWAVGAEDRIPVRRELLRFLRELLQLSLDRRALHPDESRGLAI